MRGATFLGTVESVTGSTVTIGLDPSTQSGLVFIEGQGHRVGQVGSFIRIPQGFTSLFGIVTQAGVAAAPTPELRMEASSRRWLTAEVVGEGRAGEAFARGVYRYPTINDEVHLVTEADLGIVYGNVASREHVEVGYVSSARTIPARVDVNRLISRHCAVVGATGSGKSNTVAGLLDRLSDPERFPSSRILVLDIHGEYAPAFGDRANVFRINPDKKKGERPFVVPYWSLSFDELLAVTLGEIGDEGSRGRVVEWISARKQRAAKTAPFKTPLELVTVDTALPFSIHQLWFELRRESDATYNTKNKNGDVVEQNETSEARIEDGDADTVMPAKFAPNDGKAVVFTKSKLNIRRQLDALGSRLRDPRLAFLFRPGPWSVFKDGLPERDLDALLGAWLGGSDDSRPVTILDLSGVPASILDQLIGVLLRLLFDALFWGREMSEGGRERPLLVVMEEAHTYLSKPESAAALAVKRIVKEGRKYGLGAMIVSQRPTEIDATVLSQCGTIFALRMGNASDRGHVGSATTDSLKGLLDLLPTLRTGEAIIVGEAVHLPTRAMIHRPPLGRRPNSEDPRVVAREYDPGEVGPGGWDKPIEKADYADLVASWRRQDGRSAHLHHDPDEEPS